jgi:RNA methyltransferase, TrmH family
VITSASNARVVDAVRLKKRAARERARRFLVEGPRGIQEALTAGAGLLTLFHCGPSEVVSAAAARGVQVFEVDESIMKRLTTTVTPQGVVGIAEFVDLELEEVQDGCIALLHAVRDPGNAGAVLRSADAAGAQGVVLSTGCADVYNPKTVRAAAGSLFHLPIVRGVDTSATVRRLHERNVRVVGMAADAETSLDDVDLDAPVAFLFGNESWGLPDETAALADVRARIPIAARAESLNLAAAAAVCLFEYARRARRPDVGLERLIASAVHDIRSPLTAMKGFTYALSNRWTQMNDEQRATMFRGIALDTDRMDAIVRLISDAARLGTGRLDLFPERIDVGEVVEEIRVSAAQDPEHPQIHWTGGQVRAFVDPHRLRSAVQAFVEAERWWAREGPIEVAASSQDGRLVVEVARSGADLAAGPEELFEARRPGSGSGSKIGLFVARGVARAQGGSATAAVADGRLAFRLDLPNGAPRR